MKVRIAIQRSPQETRKQYSAHCDGGMAGIALSAATPTQGPEGSNHKPKRVRTGCLTCRQRHLKCDESYPDCVNCRKSSRKCQRGVRLNFIDTTVHRTPILSAHENWSIKFQDESREIASEYRGGLAQYPSAEARSPARREDQVPLTPIDQGPTSTIVHRPLLPFESHAANQYIEDSLDDTYNAPSIANSTISTSSTTYPTYSLSTTPNTPYRSSEPLSPPGLEGCTYLDNQEEVLFLQVFVEEVGLWMDSMDPMKHFSRLLPFQALHEPMLRNAFLACGARHLSLVNTKYGEEKALHYYDAATLLLCSALQNPNRDSIVCATTAVVLNVYEIMCERAVQRMNHIAGARALIKECGWNAQSTGIGAACFWLNVGMELLSCLRFNWQVAWEPDDWGLDMDFTHGTKPGYEDLWAYRIMYVVAKVGNFRASMSLQGEASPQLEHYRLQSHYNEWTRLRDLCLLWDGSVPITMRPLGYLHPSQTASKSAFPEIWYIKRATIVARLFYHTAMCLIADINPVMPNTAPEMKDMRLTHSRQICGIVAHLKDRGVASVALRSLAIAAEFLTNLQEQKEVLQVFNKIQQETGWRIGFIHEELQRAWGWPAVSPSEPLQAQQYQQQSMMPTIKMHVTNPTTSPQQHVPQTIQTTQPLTQQQDTYSVRAPPRIPSPIVQATIHGRLGGIMNPLLAAADFSMPQHPYQSHYVAPSLPALQTQLPY